MVEQMPLRMDCQTIMSQTQHLAQFFFFIASPRFFVTVLVRESLTAVGRYTGSLLCCAASTAAWRQQHRREEGTTGRGDNGSRRWSPRLSPRTWPARQPPRQQGQPLARAVQTAGCSSHPPPLLAPHSPSRHCTSSLPCEGASILL